MTRSLRAVRAVRLLPILVAALTALGTVKIISVILVGGYVLTPVVPAIAQEAPGKLRQSKIANPADPNAADAASEAGDGEQLGDGAGQGATDSDSERLLLESLRQRREEIDQRGRELDMREQLLKAAEQRIDEKIAELKAIESRVSETFKAKDDEDDAQLGDLVKMYAAMKPKKAARIFDRLDLRVLIGLARRMKPTDLADVIAVMDPAVAERVTIALASAVRQRAEPAMDELAPVTPQ